MPKERILEPRFDFSGGRNTRQSADMLQSNEMRDLTNWRISDSVGGLVKRTGSRRMHPTGLGASVDGLYQWDSPSGKQIVAIAGGDLHYKTSAWGDFSSTSPAPALSTTLSTNFTTARSNAEDAPLYLYLADGNLWRWTGSALTKLTGEYYDAETPPNLLFEILDADLVESYHVRLFYRALSYPQSLYWSALGDPEDFEVDLYDSGGAAMVGVQRGEELVALGVIGSSMIVMAPDSIVRFTGYSDDDIQIEQDTEGISNSVGAIARQGFSTVETFGVLLTERGLYAITEESATPLGVKVDPDFSALDRSELANAVVCYHKGRQEIWVAVSGADDTGNQTVYVLSVGAVQAWTGPFAYPFAITCMSPYEDSNGDEWIMAGCSDGYVRLLDTGTKDDVTSAGTGGSLVDAMAVSGPIFMPVGPMRTKTLVRIYLEAEIPEGKLFTVGVRVDGGEWLDKIVEGQGGSLRSYRIDVELQGKRFEVRLVDDTDDLTVVSGYTLEAFDMLRT